MSLGPNDLYSSGYNARQSPALAASMRLSQGYPPQMVPADVEHLELRQELIDRESIVLLQQQRERLQEAHDVVRQKEMEAEVAKLESLKGNARLDALEGALARTSAKKTLVEKELADAQYSLSQERRAADALRKEKADLSATLASYRTRGDDYEARLRALEARVADGVARNAHLEAQAQELSLQARNGDAARARLLEAEREIVDLRARIGVLERDADSLSKTLDASRSELTYERSKKAELSQALSRTDATLATTMADARRLESELQLRESQIHAKEAELSSAKRLQDTLAREGYETRKAREEAEQAARMAAIQLENERRDRAERARSRLSVLERRSGAEELVSSCVDGISNLAGSTRLTSSLTASGRAPITSIASPLTVSRASERMTKNQIRDLINNIDRSLVN